MDRQLKKFIDINFKRFDLFISQNIYSNRTFSLIIKLKRAKLIAREVKKTRSNSRNREMETFDSWNPSKKKKKRSASHRTGELASATYTMGL